MSCNVDDNGGKEDQCRLSDVRLHPKGHQWETCGPLHALQPRTPEHGCRPDAEAQVCILILWNTPPWSPTGGGDCSLIELHQVEGIPSNNAIVFCHLLFTLL